MARGTQGGGDAAAPHVLIIPYPSQGHILPLLDLASLLSRRGHVITIAVTPKNLPFLSPLLASSPSVRPLVIPFPIYPSLPQNVENAKDLPPSSLGRNLSLLIHALSYLHAPLLDWSRSVANPPDVIVVDFFVGWANKLADQLSVPCITFCPYGPFALSVVRCLWRDMPKRPETSDGPNFPISFPFVPGSPVFPWYQLSSIYRSYEDGDPVSEFVRECFLENFRGWGFIFDSFYELEGDYLDHVRRELGHERVWAVGPLNRAGRCPAGERGGPPSVPAGDVLTWLDGFEAGSVVYVSFGSQFVLTAAQGAALAAGLERSGARFVWCVKEAAVVVPEGFEERVRGRGMVIRGWAPQVELLSHESVGAFLTHCGWNSVLEGVSAGVMLLTWPLMADQYMNARLVLEEAGVGVRVCEGADAVPDPDELARILAEAASTAGKGEEKMRVWELRRKALDAVREGGSSNQDFNAMVEEMNKLKLKGDTARYKY